MNRRPVNLPDNILEQDSGSMNGTGLAAAGQMETAIKIEKLEWAKNWGGRVNDYDSDITVWVTAIVEISHNKFARVGFDLLDCTMMSSDTGCSGNLWN